MFHTRNCQRDVICITWNGSTDIFKADVNPRSIFSSHIQPANQPINQRTNERTNQSINKTILPTLKPDREYLLHSNEKTQNSQQLDRDSGCGFENKRAHTHAYATQQNTRVCGLNTRTYKDSGILSLRKVTYQM
jgi:hypothetical protein